MKTRIATLVLVSLLVGFTGFASIGGDDTTTTKVAAELQFRAAINECHNNVVEFRIEKPQADKVWLKVLDEKGMIVFAKRIKKCCMAEVDCNISSLPAGKYDYLVLRNGQEELRKTIAKK